MCLSWKAMNGIEQYPQSNLISKKFSTSISAKAEIVKALMENINHKDFDLITSIFSTCISSKV